jgi:hypothetical protein
VTDDRMREAGVVAQRLILAHINNRKDSWVDALDNADDDYAWCGIAAHLTDIAAKALIELHGPDIAATLCETKLARMLDQPWSA